MIIPLSWILAASLIFGLIATALAYKFKRNPYLWFFVGFIFGLWGVLSIFITLIPRHRAERQKAPSKPELHSYIEGPMDRFWYYLDKSREQRGPMSHNALTRAWKKGEVALSTLVWHEDLSNWKQLQDLIRYRESTHLTS
jgi:hypothetical protein